MKGRDFKMIDFKDSSLNIIKERRSVRTYTTRQIEQEKKDILSREMLKLNNDIFRFALIDNLNFNGDKISTYGMIKGGDTYLVGILNTDLLEDQNAAIKFGYAFEQIILKATELGLGTCWLSATFNKDNVKKLLHLSKNESIPIISPLGYADRIRGTEKLIRHLGKANKRKEWNELFFNNDFETPLKKWDAGNFASALDMLRIAPSTKNIQPWRVVKTNNRFDFYIDNSAFTKIKNVYYNFTYNDMGIAKLHFESVVNEKGLSGQWAYIKDIKPYDNKTYVYSWIF